MSDRHVSFDMLETPKIKSCSKYKISIMLFMHVDNYEK